MRRIQAILYALVLICFLSSCSKSSKEVNSQPNTTHDNVAISIFKDLWRASNLPNGLAFGDTWDTDAFTMTFSENSNTITINFESKNHSISECFEEGLVFLNAVSYGGNYQTLLFDSELFYMTALLENIDEHSASMTISRPTDAKSIMIIVVADAVVYNEMLFIQ